MNTEPVVLSERLGAAILTGSGVTLYAEALLTGKSEDLTYGDIQEFQNFTTSYFATTLDDRIAIVHRPTYTVLRNTPGDPLTFKWEGTTLRYYSDEILGEGL